MKNYLKLALIPLGMMAFQSCNTYKSAATIDNKMTELVNTKWTLKSLDGKAIGDKYASLTLDTKKGNQVNIKAPCNGYFGAYTIDTKKKTVTFPSLAGTMKMCGEPGTMEIENSMIKALNDQTLHYVIKGNDMTLMNDKMQAVMTFEYQTTNDQIAYLLKHNWKLIQMNNKGMDYTQNLSFNKAGTNSYKTNGFAGCNTFFGNVAFKGNNIHFDNIGATRMACMGEAGEQETELLSTLGMHTLTFDIADQVLNIYNGEKLVLMFARNDSKQ